jgi:hypothetical protein
VMALNTQEETLMRFRNRELFRTISLRLQPTICLRLNLTMMNSQNNLTSTIKCNNRWIKLVLTLRQEEIETVLIRLIPISQLHLGKHRFIILKLITCIVASPRIQPQAILLLMKLLMWGLQKSTGAVLYKITEMRYSIVEDMVDPRSTLIIIINIHLDI